MIKLICLFVLILLFKIEAVCIFGVKILRVYFIIFGNIKGIIVNMIIWDKFVLVEYKFL